MNQYRRIQLLAVLASVLFTDKSGSAQPIQLTDIPPDLVEWIPWVLEQHPAYKCPMVDGEAVCVWPGALSFDVNHRSGTFEQSVHTDRETEVMLPGSLEHWPTEVRVDNKPTAVLQRGEQPVVRVRAGDHRIGGRFLWPRVPEVIQIPEASAQVFLRVNGQPVVFPKRDRGGKLWLKVSSAEEATGEKLELDIHRRIDDAVPLLITTRLMLRTGGNAREVNLGNVLLDGTVALQLTTELPARLDPGGNLLVQVRAGSYKIEITARTETSPASLQPSRQRDLLPDQEVWVWSANEHLRQVEISGAARIDSARTSLEADWRDLPAYLMRAGDRMLFTTQRRGQPDPPPDRLNLERQLWLDLDGRGYTVRDRITGDLQKNWRLDLVSGVLGHVASSGVDQLITKAPHSGHTGVELRQTDLDLVAEWRAEKNLETLPAVAWSEDVQSLSTTLNLPPGWSLFSASGVDTVETWISKWDLLGFFYVLLVALAVGRLVGVAWGVLALFALTLCFHERDAPYLIWLVLLVPVALLKVLPKGRLRWIARLGWWASVIALLIIGIPFAANQIRTALFPQISNYERTDPFDLTLGAVPAPAFERMAEQQRGQEDTPEWLSQSQQGELKPETASAPSERDKEEEETFQPSDTAAKHTRVPVKTSRKIAKEKVGGVGESSDVAQSAYQIDARMAGRGKDIAKQKVALTQDPTAVVQTGPGVPKWSFRSWDLSWSGPVAKDHQLHLRLISPNINRLLSFLRVILSALLAFCLIRSSRPGLPKAKAASTKASQSAAAATTALVILLLNAAISRADLPDEVLLNDLSSRLTREAACQPDCVSVNVLHLRIDKNDLKMTAEVHAGAQSSVRIPGPAQVWVPNQVRFDTSAYARVALFKDGFLHARVTQGIHRIEVSGPLPPVDSFTLTLGDAPHRVTVDAQGWIVDGLREDGRAEGSIQLNREIDISDVNKRVAETLSPWLEVTREFEIGINWRIHSTLRRVSPTGSPVVVRFPLLEGESVTESRLLVEKKHLIISLGRDDRAFTWSSTLKESNRVSLIAAKGKPWSEIWVIRCGPVWNCHLDGLAPVKHIKEDLWEPIFYPWPNEKINLSIIKPSPATGQSTTIDSAELEVSPGVRILKARLNLAIRSSKGGVQTVTLPKGSRIQTIQIDGNATPIRYDGEKLSFNLKPGPRSVVVDWQQSQGVSAIQKVPKVGLGSPATNARVVLKLPEDRWLLWTSGPSWGPAILFWGYLLFVLLVAFVLPRIPNSPLKPWQWILLGFGLTQIPAPALLVVVGWFFAMAYRQRGQLERAIMFDLSQLGLVAWTVMAMIFLYQAVHQGLLFEPDMQVIGAGSSAERLVWYVDRVQTHLPTPLVLNVSIWIWKIAMLLWSLWLASSLVKWLPWAWQCLSTQGIWKPVFRKKAVKE